MHVHPDRFHLAALLSEKRLAPIPSENFPFVVDYGDHFDAHLLGEYLKGLATSRGVRHLQARVTDVGQAPNGDISSLSTDTGDELEADFFVDCSGFRGTLIQGALKIPFLPFADNLFNDSAVVLPTEQAERIGPFFDFCFVLGSVCQKSVKETAEHYRIWDCFFHHRHSNAIFGCRLR